MKGFAPTLHPARFMNFQDWNFCMTLLWMISLKKKVGSQHTELDGFVNCLFPLFQSLCFHCHLTEMPLIFLVSRWVLIAPSFKDAEVWLCIVVAERWTLPGDAPEEVGILSLEHYSVFAEDYYNISQSDWRFFFLFSDVPLDIPKADQAVQSIFSLFISLTLKRVIMFRERCI